MSFSVLLAAVAILSLTALYRWRKKTFSYFKDLGIPGPEPNLLWGNIREYHENGRFRALSKWFREYGDTYGFYNGDVPTLVTKNLDFLQYVFVQNMSNFTDKGATMLTDQRHPFLGQSIMHAKGDHWRRLRGAVSGSFTSAKLRQMMPHISGVADIFMDVLSEKAKLGKEVEMLVPSQALTMDYVGRAAFGIDTSSQRDLKNPFFVTARSVLPGIMKGPFHAIAHCTTAFGDFMKPFYWLNRVFGTFTFDIFADQTTNVIQLRKHNPELRRPDILQSLLDAQCDDDNGDHGTLSTNGTSAGNTKSKSLCLEETVMLTTTLFLAAFDTTGNALAYLWFTLARYPDVQDKVRQEVEDAVAHDGTLDYEAVTLKLKYLTQVVNETLRLYPPGLTFTAREAKEDFVFNGIKYKAGTSIMSPTFDIHMDERYWPDPLKFDPDRFSPDNAKTFHNLAYQPFGIGPRNCVGSRMALLEVVYTAARVVQRFELKLGASQKGIMDLGTYGMVSTPSQGPWIVFRELRT